LAGDFLECFSEFGGTIAARWDSRKVRAVDRTAIARDVLSREACSAAQQNLYAKYAGVESDVARRDPGAGEPRLVRGRYFHTLLQINARQD
jgi:hypothetical protein